MKQRFFVRRTLDNLYLAASGEWVARDKAELYTEAQLKIAGADNDKVILEEANVADFLHWCGRRGGKSRSPAKLRSALLNLAKAKKGKAA